MSYPSLSEAAAASFPDAPPTGDTVLLSAVKIEQLLNHENKRRKSHINTLNRNLDAYNEKTGIGETILEALDEIQKRNDRIGLLVEKSLAVMDNMYKSGLKRLDKEFEELGRSDLSMLDNFNSRENLAEKFKNYELEDVELADILNLQMLKLRGEEGGEEEFGMLKEKVKTFLLRARESLKRKKVESLQEETRKFMSELKDSQSKLNESFDVTKNGVEAVRGGLNVSRQS